MGYQQKKLYSTFSPHSQGKIMNIVFIASGILKFFQISPLSQKPMNDLTQMSKIALSYTVTRAQGGYCEAENRKALSLRE